VKVKKLNFIWAEKYRPETLDDMVLPEKVEAFLKTIITKKDMPHLLLVGGAGTGKTTASRIIIKSLGWNYIELNASDERGIDTIRGKIKNFVSLSGKKIIFLDEADNLTKDSQWSLRSIIEKYANVTRFILTANYINKLIEPIISRFVVLNFENLDKSKIKAYLTKILKSEKITFVDEDLDKVIDRYYCDIRAMINYLQYHSSNGTFKFVDETLSQEKIYQAILHRNILAVRQNLNGLDYNALYRYLFEKFYQAKNEKALLILANYLYKNSLVQDPEINFLACAIELFSVVK
jgi:DNA polymerase III delta prime subunit